MERGRCKAHAIQKTRNRKYDTARWGRIRAAKLRADPFCAEHLRQDPPQTVLANEVHHKDNDANNDAPENLESLCKACHARIGDNLRAGLHGNLRGDRGG